MKKYFVRKVLPKEELNYVINLVPELKKFINEDLEISFRINTDLFSCIVHTIIAQQISNAALDAIWHKIVFSLKQITPKIINKTDFNLLCDLGISKNKANTIKQIANDFLSKKLDEKKIKKMNDNQIYELLSQYKGIGKWTIDNILIFSLYRNNIFPIDDFGIKKGLRLVFGKKLNDSLIKKITVKCDQHLTVLSLVLWYISNTN